LKEDDDDDDIQLYILAFHLIREVAESADDVMNMTTPVKINSKWSNCLKFT